MKIYTEKDAFNISSDVARILAEHSVRIAHEMAIILLKKMHKKN